MKPAIIEQQFGSLIWRPTHANCREDIVPDALWRERDERREQNAQRDLMATLPAYSLYGHAYAARTAFCSAGALIGPRLLGAAVHCCCRVGRVCCAGRRQVCERPGLHVQDSNLNLG
jgi:hypothetical protein